MLHSKSNKKREPDVSCDYLLSILLFYAVIAFATNFLCGYFRLTKETSIVAGLFWPAFLAGSPILMLILLADILYKRGKECREGRK